MRLGIAAGHTSSCFDMCLHRPQRALNALSLEHVLSALSTSLDSPPSSRRTIGGRAPAWRPEAAAAQRLIDAGFMGGLLDCLSIFFKLAHASDPEADVLLAEKLMRLRKNLRCVTRPQALGKSGLGVDLDIFLRQIIEEKFGITLDAIFVLFFEGSGYSEKLWSAEQARPMARPEPTAYNPLPRCGCCGLQSY